MTANTFRFIAVVLTCLAAPVAAQAQATEAACCGERVHILAAVTEDKDQARTVEHARVKGGPENNLLENVQSPVRAGLTAFKHSVTTDGERSELGMQRTQVGEAYWYGWSMYVPEDFEPAGHYTIVMQMAAWPSNPWRIRGGMPGGGNGHHITFGSNGQLGYTMQHRGEGKVKLPEGEEVPDIAVKKFPLGHADAMKGKWVDFVMHARLTGEPDGFLRLWVKVGDGAYERKIDHRGVTWWTYDAGNQGPYFKMGAYLGDPGWKGKSPRVLYTDEFRLGAAQAGFASVAPGKERYKVLD